jgi:hypothetical protein
MAEPKKLTEFKPFNFASPSRTRPRAKPEVHEEVSSFKAGPIRAKFDAKVTAKVSSNKKVTQAHEMKLPGMERAQKRQEFVK